MIFFLEHFQAIFIYGHSVHLISNFLIVNLFIQQAEVN